MITHSARGRRPLRVIRWGGAVIAAAALATLVAVGPLGTAQAASGNGYNQMTGQGTTSSAVTVNWSAGLLDSNNQAISAAGNELNPNPDRSGGTGPLNFMDSDFKNLQVTVSQTQNITHQAINITWSGVAPTTILGGFAEQNFLQIMECYGDVSTGPSPEDCEYGSAGMLGTGSVPNPQIESRTGWLCPAGSVANPDNPPGLTLFNEQGDGGCDPNEPNELTSGNPNHCWPSPPVGNGCPDGVFTVPFVPVDNQSPPIYDNTALGQYFNEFDTNEVQEAITSQKKTGDVQFQALTEVEASGLGCGEQNNGQPRGCWLVIVPRGGFEPNGFDTNKFVNNQEKFLYTSPLSADNWAQRIQIHLDYAPLQVSCPTGTPVLSIEGSQLIAKAVSSWQLALNKAANCARLYQYGESFETQTTTDLSVGAVGMGFTTIPVGSEASRYPGQPPPPRLPTLLYAPVAVTGLGFGFNINEGLGFTTTSVNLTPRLVAKALTQVYKWDLPDYSPNHSDPGPSWAQKNPANITDDPAFQQINPTTVIPPYPASQPIEPLTTLDRSAVNQQLWQWIQSDPATDSWLDGATDPSDPVTADPDYVKAKLGKAPADDNFPQDYTTSIACKDAHLDCAGNGSAVLTTQDVLPQFFDFDAAATTVLSANDKSTPLGSWDPNSVNPNNGLQGSWVSVGVEPPGQVFMWTVADMPDIAKYGLIPVDLCNARGKNCVAPSVTSVTKTLNSATTDSQGLLEVNPAKAPSGGYPLVSVVYAAVPTNQSAADLTAYADLIQYAVNQGQTTGSALGDLPPGYLPLTSALKSKAMSVVQRLLALANPTPGHSGTPTAGHTHPTTSSGNGTGSNAGTGTNSSGNPASGTTPGPRAGATATPASTLGSGSPTPQGLSILPPSAELAGGTTQRTNVGTIRWALIAVIIIGGGGALGGSLLRSDAIPRWLSRRRT